jgi:hypothetical protein
VVLPAAKSGRSTGCLLAFAVSFGLFGSAPCAWPWGAAGCRWSFSTICASTSIRPQRRSPRLAFFVTFGAIFVIGRTAGLRALRV